ERPADKEQLDTDIADLALSPVPSRTEEGSLDPAVWRLILLLAVFLVSVDELFRAPDPHP
ncbi:MAG: hypothetical protein JSV00_10190, partial [bacterium]